MSNACATTSDSFKGSFEEIKEAMMTDKYWINFFVRPCCPPPSFEQAKDALNKRRVEIKNRTDFSEDEQQQLLAIVDEREAWYKASPFYRG